MSGRISSRDYERLCAYLDGQLPNHEQGQMAHELQKRPDLRQELEQLRRTRQVLRSVPMHKVPHNFILTRAMVTTRKSPLLIPIFQFASALSTLAVVVLLILDLSMGTLFQSAAAASAPKAAVRVAAVAATQAPSPQIIEWNNATGGGSGSVMAAPLGLGGGNGGGPSTTSSGLAAPTEAPGVASDMTALSAMTPAPSTLPTEAVGVALSAPTPEVVQPMLNTTSATVQPPAMPVAPTAAPAFSAQSENNSANNSPILGIPPADQQGKIITSPTPTSAPESVVSVVFPFRRLLELVLALLAVGTAVAALLLRRQR